MAKSEDKPKVEKPMAPTSGKLPEPQAGCEWDTTEIGPYRFAIQVAKTVAGITTLAKSEAKAVGLFNRAWRILVPQALDARATKKDAMTADWATKVQADILAFDPAAVRTRAPRRPPEVAATKAEVKALGIDPAKLAEFLKARNITLNVQ